MAGFDILFFNSSGLCRRESNSEVRKLVEYFKIIITVFEYFDFIVISTCRILVTRTTNRYAKIMSNVLDDPEEYKKNPLYDDHIYGDFTPFYVAITFCTLIGVFLIVLNVFFCWCSSHKYYWKDSDTGNRWILPVWVKLPYKQPPLDLSELEGNYSAPRPVYDTEVPEEFLELHKRESDL